MQLSRLKVTQPLCPDRLLITRPSRRAALHSLTALAAALFITACARPASTSPAPAPTVSSLYVSIVRVRVSPRNGIFIAGETNLPNGECVQTSLLAGGEAVPWWPEDVCVQADSGLWELLVPLGRRGAPETLSADLSYELQAWWLNDPQHTRTTLHFDLSNLEMTE